MVLLSFYNIAFPRFMVLYIEATINLKGFERTIGLKYKN